MDVKCSRWDQSWCFKCAYFCCKVWGTVVFCTTVGWHLFLKARRCILVRSSLHKTLTFVASCRPSLDRISWTDTLLWLAVRVRQSWSKQLLTLPVSLFHLSLHPLFLCKPLLRSIIPHLLCQQQQHVFHSSALWVNVFTPALLYKQTGLAFGSPAPCNGTQRRARPQRHRTSH